MYAPSRSVVTPAPLTSQNHSSRPGQHRPEPREQEHARFHHGRRVQVGGHRRRRRHRPRQPEVKRELGALGERPEQHQHERDGVERVGANELARREHHVEIVAADDVAEHDDATEQREAACAGHGQRHARASPRVHAVMPVADEQERNEARQLPEEDELDEVTGEDDAEHRAHEREEERVEARHRIFGRHVIARVEGRRARR